MSAERTRRQLELIAEFASLAAGAGIECWLRGGWALDFLLGRVTRPHGDIDLFVWAADAPELLALLAEHGYDEIGGPRREQQRNLVKAGKEFHVSLLKRNEHGVVTAGGRWAKSPWPVGMLDGPVGRIGDVRCRVISAQAQLWAKEEVPKALGHTQREYDPVDIELLREVLAAQRGDALAEDRLADYTRAIVERLRNILGPNLAGVYLHGSLVLGDFSEARNDVDAVAVATRSLSQEEKHAIGASLSEHSLPCPASGLEFHFLREDALVAKEAPLFELHVATSSQGRSDRVIDGRDHGGDTDLVMHFAVLRAYGRTLIGPPAGEVFPAIPRRLLLRAFLGELEWARQHASSSYQVLNACRAWRYADEGVLCSKTDGGEWARVKVEHASPITAALQHRAGVADVHPASEAAAALVATIEIHLRHAIGTP